MFLRPHNAANRAFTLVELMVVIVIIAVMSAVMVGEMRGSFEDALLRSTARKVIDLCDAASNRAVSVHHPYVLRFESARGHYLLRPKAENPEEVGIAAETEMRVEGDLDSRIAMVIREPQQDEEAPEDISAASEERDRRARADVITFYPDGTADGREFAFKDRMGAELLLRLNPVTGRVRIVETEPETK